MTSGLRPYPEYKESELPWLGRVPAHWAILRAKYLFRCIDIRSTSGEEELLTVSSERGVVPRSSMKVTMFKAESYVGHKICWPGDLVINSLWAWARGLGVSKHHGIISSAYGVYRLRDGLEHYVDFIHHLVRSAAFHWELQVRSKGIWTSRLQLTDYAFLDTPIVFPPTIEVTRIVQFIAGMERRVNHFIRNRRRLIEVLNEQKQAIINRAVTRGLDSNVPLKPSGSDCLENIPVQWKVLRLKHLLGGIDQGVSPQAENRLADASNWGVLKAGCVNHGVFRPKEHKRLPTGFEIDTGIIVHAGDVLVSRACGSPDLVGSVAKVTPCEYKLILSDKTFRLRFKKQEMVDFFVTAMNAKYFRNQVRLAISGAGGLANNLPVSSLINFVLAVPPYEEAQSIHAAVADNVFLLVLAIDKAQREIDLVREYRTRLIADVVTGKADVRHLAQETFEAEAADLEEALEDELPGEDEAELAEEAAHADD